MPWPTALLVLLALGCENERTTTRPEATGSAARVAIAPPVIAIDAAVANVPRTTTTRRSRCFASGSRSPA